MSTVAVSFVDVCAGGCHVTVSASIDGGQAIPLRLNADEVLVPLANSEAPDVVTNLLRVRWRGKTRAQCKTDLQSGITMTV